MNADGSGQHRLTYPPKGTEDITADWSPMGPGLPLLVLHRGVRIRSGSCVPDGTGLRQLTPYCRPGRGIPKCKADDRSAPREPHSGTPPRPRRLNAVNVALSGKTPGRFRPQTLSPEVAAACRPVISR